MPSQEVAAGQLWQLVLPRRLRVLMQDLDFSNANYAEESLIDIICTSAKFVSSDAGLDTKYSINTAMTTISPDPLAAPEDEFFTYLVLLRAQLSILTGEWRKSVRKSISVQLGRVQINTAVGVSLYKDLIDSLKNEYDSAITNYQLNLPSTHFAIFSGAPTGPEFNDNGGSLPLKGNISW